MTAMPATPRKYHAPQALCSSGFGPYLTLDEMDLYSATRTGPQAEWAAKVLARENSRTLDELLGESKFLPRGVLADAGSDEYEVVEALVADDGRYWTASKGWHESETPLAASIELSDDDVAFIVRAMREGADSVVMRAFVPLAFVSAAESSPGSDAPEGSVVVAIVDPIDRDAVLELLAVAPGPKVFRRHDGQWQADDAWVPVLASVKPPPMVKLDADRVGGVASQVDSATSGMEFEPFKESDRDMYAPISASAYLAEIEAEGLERRIQMNMALVAVAGRELSPKDIKNTEQLRRYWLYGKGAAKIRWFTPGAWRRCYRQVVKYMGPKMAPGYCTNLSQRLGGPGVATHVGD